MYPTVLYLFFASVVISDFKIPESQTSLSDGKKDSYLLKNFEHFLTVISRQTANYRGNSHFPDSFEFINDLILNSLKEASMNNGALNIEHSKSYFIKNTGIKSVKGFKQDSLLNVTEKAARHGFIAQEYTVETKDGYLLGLQRIRSTYQTNGAPVLLMHGLLLSAACFVDAGPKAGLAYLLAEAGHDVWLGNARGNFYSRAHLTLNPDKSPEYWQFSADEIGKYDLPATIDTVLNATGANKLNYIGYSQGAGTYFIMCSELPHYCTKANVVIGLAPSSRHLLTKSPVFRTVCKFFERHHQLLSEAGIYEALPRKGWVQTFLNIFCNKSDSAAQLCQILNDLLDGHHPRSITKESLQLLVASFPAGTSVQNMARFGQTLKAETMLKFDYGPEKNLQKYQSKVPPEYNLSSVTVPVVVIYGRNDGLVDIDDVKWLVRRLPNLVEAYEVEDPLWTHMDVPYSRHVPTLLYPKIKHYLNKYL